jgi:hypothetical protein
MWLNNSEAMNWTECHWIIWSSLSPWLLLVTVYSTGRSDEAARPIIVEQPAEQPPPPISKFHDYPPIVAAYEGPISSTRRRGEMETCRWNWTAMLLPTIRGDPILKHKGF